MSKKLFILPLLLLLASTVCSQTFPVTASTNLTPPYSLNLSDYVAPGSQRLALNIFLADINRPELQARLRLRIEGQGIRLETKPSYLPAPLILQGGVPERLIAADLADYFDPENLNFQGISKQQFLRTGQLPEGLYQFCFEVLEYNRGARVSNSACAMAWLILNDPPIINLPQQNEKVRAQEPQYVTFQWMPRHTGSPNAAFSTEYNFALVELWPDNRDPNDAILTTPHIYETTTQSNTLIYGPAETPLVPGRSYAFRVQAKSIAGIEELDLFKNNGYSQTHAFTYGDACNLPQNISAEALNSVSFRISWQANPNNTNFSVRYRKAVDSNATWYEQDSFFEEIAIDGLQAETTYEYQLTGGCNAFSSTYSPIATITTEAAPEINYSCGLPPENYDFGNAEPLPGLQRDDILYAGDFDVRISEATGSAGTFTGKGTVVVPYLDNLAVGVEFTSITVNTDYRMTAGSMNVKGIGVDVLPDNITDFIDKLDETLASLDDVLTDVSDGITKIKGITSGVAVENDSIVITLDDGTIVKAGLDEIADNEDGDKVIEDEEGNTWVVDSEGNVSKGGSGAGNTQDGSTDEKNHLTGLDSLVYEIIVLRIESDQAVIDSLKEKMQPFTEEIEGIIENENFYPPRIRGENDELIGEGISLHIAIVEKPENVKERLSPSVKSIDDARNSLIAIDIPIQELKPAIELLNELKEGDRFEEFVTDVRSNTALPESTTDRIQFIEELLDQRISENEE